MSEVMVHVMRGELVESMHRGDLAVVDWTGKLLYNVGSPREKVTYLRSSAKPMQALPVVESGAAERFALSDEELAVMCASHSGEERHVETVRRILKKIGLDESALQCGTHWPLDTKTTQLMQRQGQTPTEVHCNCSGKHSGMLALCRYHGWDIADYTALEHPLQQMLLDKVAELAVMDPGNIVVGVDGCGVPVHGMSVYNMALAFARMARPLDLPSTTQMAIGAITQAMMSEPFMVSGSGRFCTDLMHVAAGRVFGKGGAEGVYCLGIPALGLGMAMKTEDGHDYRGPAPVVTQVLGQMKILDDRQISALSHLARPVLHNHRGDVVGRILPVVELVPAAK